MNSFFQYQIIRKKEQKKKEGDQNDAGFFKNLRKLFSGALRRGNKGKYARLSSADDDVAEIELKLTK